MSELPAHDIKYPFGLTRDDLIHVGEGAGNDERCAVCGDATGRCGDVCGTCDSRVVGSYEILCANCASLNQQSGEAMRGRMREISSYLHEALHIADRIRTHGAAETHAETMAALCLKALNQIPETIRR